MTKQFLVTARNIGVPNLFLGQFFDNDRVVSVTGERRGTVNIVFSLAFPVASRYVQTSKERELVDCETNFKHCVSYGFCDVLIMIQT